MDLSDESEENIMLFWYVIWIFSLFLSTITSSYYIRKTGKSDAIMAFYCVYLALSQIFAAKIGSFSFGFYIFTAPGAVMLYPFLYQLNDLSNEYFGEAETRKMIFIAFATQLFMILAIYLSISLPSFGYPQNVSESDWRNIFWSGIRITGASWTAFLASNNLDAWIYPRIKQLTGGRLLWLRNAGSDFISLTLDSLIFVPLAFYGTYPFSTIWILILGQIGTKYFFGLVDTPFLYLSRYIVGEKKGT